MDSVSRTLGILPILQGFSNLQEKIHSLRHYRKEVKWLRIRVKGQVRCFNQQINHLAIDTFGNRKAQSLLIRDDDHAHWKNKDLDGPLKRHMGELLDEFIGAIGKVKAALEQIEAKLAIFAPPDVMVSSAVPKIAFTTANSVSAVSPVQSYERRVSNCL